MEDYIHIDEEVITDCALSLEEIVDEGKDEGSQQTDSERMGVEQDEADLEEPVISSLEAAKAMDIVRRFAEKNFADPEILKHSDALDEAIYKHRAKNQTQKKLTDYFH